MKRLIKKIFSIWPFNKIIYVKGPGFKNQIAITFDDGPNPEYTAQVINILREAKVPATFFLEGRWVEKYEDLVSAIIENGYEVGCHGYDHDDKDVIRQSKRGFAALEAKGVNTNLFRPPSGLINIKAAIKLILDKKKIVLWSFDAHDSMRYEGKWQEPPDYNALKSGDIILMHDDNPVCVKELPELIKTVKQKGLKIVRISEML